MNAASETDFEEHLRRGLYRFACPSSHTLGEYELDLVAPEVRTAIAGHVLGCPRCAVEMRVVRRRLAEDAPGLAVETAGEGVWAPVRRIVARLLEPPRTPAAAGLRGTNEAGSKSYRAEGVTITIAMEPGARRGRVTMVGLIEESGDSGGVAGAAARLIEASGSSYGGAVNALGNVVFEDVPEGTYRLEVQLPQHIVAVEDLRVRA